MATSETLCEALDRVGDSNESNLLTPEAQNLTKADISDFLSNHGNHNLSKTTVSSLIKLSKERIKAGKSVFPWDSMEEVEHTESDDNIGGAQGGCW